MFEKLEVLRLADGLARHSAARQGEIARNVANADTPGYRAGDISAFAETYDRAGTPLRATRPAHLAGAGGAAWQRVDAPDETAPDGNTVSLEDQMLKAAEARQGHELALTVYSTALSILRASLGGGR